MATAVLGKRVAQSLAVSYEEYLELADASRLVEWVEGEVITTMPPANIHQDICLFLSTLIKLFVHFFNLGILRFAPFEVKLWPDGPSREPDILFIAAANQAQLTPARYEGGPDLIIEIVSPDSVKRDYANKLLEYERAGVREYWIVDPRPHQQHSDFYRLGTDGEYVAAPVDDAGCYHSTILPGFWLKAEWLWQDPLPDPQRIFAEIMASHPGVAEDVRTLYRALYEMLQAREVVC